MDIVFIKHFFWTSGQVSGQGRTLQDSFFGQVRTGQDRTGQDRSQDRSGQVAGQVRTGRRTGQDIFLDSAGRTAPYDIFCTTGSRGQVSK